VTTSKLNLTKQNKTEQIQNNYNISMTIRNKSFASAPTEDEMRGTNNNGFNAVAVSVNADYDDNNIPFAHATSVELLEQTTLAQTPVAYSTGKPPQPPQQQQQQQQQQQPQSSSIAVATGAPTSTQTAAAAATTTTHRRNNNQCCAGWTCCGITCVILSSIFICCVLPFIIAAIAITTATQSVMPELDDEFWTLDDDYLNANNDDLYNTEAYGNDYGK
jgi:hypothetical protein